MSSIFWYTEAQNMAANPVCVYFYYTSRFCLTSCISLILHSIGTVASWSTFEGTMRVLCSTAYTVAPATIASEYIHSISRGGVPSWQKFGQSPPPIQHSSPFSDQSLSPSTRHLFPKIFTILIHLCIDFYYF